MSMEPESYRHILSRLPTGVTVVAAIEPGGEPRGLTASAVTALSLDPPLVLACVDRAADTHDCIERAGAFAVSILGDEDEPVARRFAESPGGAKFEGVAYREEVTGAPVLVGALGWMDCRVWATYDGGDHSIFVGEVVAGFAGSGYPLVYFRGEYGRIAT
jgi:flavin reductase (DIM6/NTAB) family NADH-FMN oxidoreductase RutF